MYHKVVAKTMISPFGSTVATDEVVTGKGYGSMTRHRARKRDEDLSVALLWAYLDINFLIGVLRALGIRPRSITMPYIQKMASLPQEQVGDLHSICRAWMFSGNSMAM